MTKLEKIMYINTHSASACQTVLCTDREQSYGIANLGLSMHEDAMPNAESIEATYKAAMIIMIQKGEL